MSALLTLAGLTVERGGKKILQEVLAEFESGRIVSLIGPNGSGKTTLLKAIAGLLPWDSKRDEGRVLFMGRDLRHMSPLERAERVTYVGSSLFTDFPVTAYQAVEIGRFCHSGPAVESAIHSAMDLTQTWELRNRLLNTMSSGELQRIALARAIAQDARVLILDESLSQMDLHFQLSMGSLLKDLAAAGKLILWVAHDVNLSLRFADECVVIRDGIVLAQGLPGDVLSIELIRQVYPHRSIEIEEIKGRIRVSY